MRMRRQLTAKFNERTTFGQEEEEEDEPRQAKSRA
jgi:hypothetical protein